MSNATWVPENERTPLWRIFNDLYMCRVPVFRSRTVEDIEMFGTPASGDSEYDKTMLNERRAMMLTINQMVEYYKRGVVIGLMKTEDSKKIYEVIIDHLKLWQDTLTRSPNVRPDNEVLDDLVQLDKFASAVYQHAQHFFKQGFIESFLLRRMTSLGSAIGLPSTASMELPTLGAPVEKKEWQPQPRESLADIFAARREVSSGSWHGKGRG